MKRIIILIINNRFTHPFWKFLFLIWKKLFTTSYSSFESQVFFPHNFNNFKRLALVVWSDLNYSKRKLYWENNSGLSWHNRSENIDYLNVPNRKFIFENICEFLNKNRDYDVIEYGCGNGIFITQIASKTRGNRHNYIGVDLNKEIITINKQKYKHTKVNFKTGSADEIPRKEKSIIMFFGTLMYIENSSIRNIFNGIHENKQILAFSENSYDLQSRKSLKRDVFAYSHGYKYLLDDSNLSLTHEQIFQEENKTIFNIQCMCRVI